MFSQTISSINPPMQWSQYAFALLWWHNERDGISNHQPHHCLLNLLFRCRSIKTSKLCATGLCEGNSPVTSEFPARRASNAENISSPFDDVIMGVIKDRYSESHIDQTPHRSNTLFPRECVQMYSPVQRKMDYSSILIQTMAVDSYRFVRYLPLTAVR